MSDARPSRAVLHVDVWVVPLYTALIFVLGSLPSAPIVARGISDKVEHAAGFALLAWLACRALRRLAVPRGAGRVAAAGFALSVAVGGALELWQGLLGYRSCELYDWVADGIGALGGVLVFLLPSALAVRAKGRR